MGLPADLKAALKTRYEALTTKRAKVLAESQAQLAAIDAQIDACKAIYQNWLTLSAVDLVAQLPATGLKVTVED